MFLSSFFYLSKPNTMNHRFLTCFLPQLFLEEEKRPEHITREELCSLYRQSTDYDLECDTLDWEKMELRKGREGSFSYLLIDYHEEGQQAPAYSLLLWNEKYPMECYTFMYEHSERRCGFYAFQHLGDFVRSEIKAYASPVTAETFLKDMANGE